VAFYPASVIPPLALQATTGPAGYTFVNGTGNILTWTAPADGNDHRVLVFGRIHVTTQQTGGALAVSMTDPGGNAGTPQIFAGGAAVGGSSVTAVPLVVESGSTVTVQQSTAQSAGAAQAWLELWGS
jgi:hypothetical protein